MKTTLLILFVLLCSTFCATEITNNTHLGQSQYGFNSTLLGGDTHSSSDLNPIGTIQQNNLPEPDRMSKFRAKLGKDSGIPTERVTNTWDGSSSTNWGTAANWSLNAVPSSSNDVVIPGSMTRYPEVATDAYCLSLTVQTGASITIGSGFLTVSTYFHNYGILAMNGTGGIDVQTDLYFDSGSSTNFTSNAGIGVQRHLSILTGSNVNMTNGTLTFYGDGYSEIYTESASAVCVIESWKDSPYYVYFGSGSQGTLTINGYIQVFSGSGLKHSYTGTTILKGNLVVNSGGSCTFDAGTLSLEGGANSSISLYTGSYLNNLKISKQAACTVSLSSSINVKGNLTIQLGTLSVRSTTTPYLSYDITLGGNWINNVGIDNFLEAAGTVVINGTGTQAISTETFHNLVLNKSSGIMSLPTGSSVTCDSYDWTAGAYTVSGGTFTVTDLADTGILGTITLSSGTINYYQDTSSRVDLNANLTVSGGIFSVYGGNSEANFANISSTYLTLSGTGILDYKNQGIYISNSYSFNNNITGGTLRTVGNFNVARIGFAPTGGTIELYGSAACNLINTSGSNFWKVVINKSATVTGSGPIDINGEFKIQTGIFVAPAIMTVAGNWTNSVGLAAFIEGAGTVTIDGAGTQTMTSETYNILKLDKSSGIMSIPSGSTVTCASYDWTAGAYTVSGGTFTVTDLADPGILGTITLSSGTINYNQDASSRIDLRANLTISSGTFNVYGGSTEVSFSNIDVATLTLSGSGILDFKNRGIIIPSSYAFNDNITGGTIRTVGSFAVNRSDFNPSNGTIELYGSADCYLSSSTGSSFYSITINKVVARSGNVSVYACAINGGFTIQAANVVNLMGTVVCSNGTLPITINTGTLNLNHNILQSNTNVIVNGTMKLDNGASLQLWDAKSITVNSGGYLETIGTSAQSATFTGSYSFNVESGGNLSAAYTVFESMIGSGINIKTGAIINTTNSLNNCTFRNGQVGGTLLTINNNQTITISYANFPTNTWSGAKNVAKTINQGNLSFIGYTGGFAGAAFEQDTYNRIAWDLLPQVPSLTVSYISSTNRIQLNWTYPLTVTQYNIYRRNTPTGSFSLVGTSTTNSWSEVVPGSKYFYKVTAVTP